MSASERLQLAIEIAVNGIKFESGLKNRARDLEQQTQSEAQSETEESKVCRLKTQNRPRPFQSIGLS